MGIACSKCGSENISFQREQTASLGGSLHSFGGGKTGHGIMYWLFIGSWIWIFKLTFWMIKGMLAICTLGFSTLFTRKKKAKITGKTFTASKTFHHTVAVCQDCGNSWKA